MFPKSEDDMENSSDDKKTYLSRVASIQSDHRNACCMVVCAPEIIISERSFQENSVKNNSDSKSSPRDERGFLGLQIVHEDFTTFRGQNETEPVAQELTMV